MYYDTGEVDEDGSMVFRGTSRVYKNFRLSYEPELVGEDCWDKVSEVYKLRSEILVMRERLVTLVGSETIAARLTLGGSLLNLKRMANLWFVLRFLQRGIYLR
ncbi:unnamed protein product [Brassica oleracea]